MIFPSYTFLLLFLPLVLIGWYVLPKSPVRIIFLTIASYVFYGFWDYRFCSLLLISTIIDYVAGKNIHRANDIAEKKRWLAFSLTGNLGILGFFKYYDFFVSEIAFTLSRFGLETAPPILNIILPLGISFYTFQSISYSIDIYRGHCRPAEDFLTFACYVSMFPQLIAGPIVRYSAIDKQLRDLTTRRTPLSQFADGVWLLAAGLVKKVLIADTLAPVAEALFDGASSPGLFLAWSGTLAYTLQLYFDFSGYSDMARGLGKMLGFEFPINFNSPYKALNISDFWNRWHITLSSWLRDYLYIPLGGSHHGTARTLRNLGITMFLGGLWHGAGFTYILWGLYHGMLLIGHAAWQRFRTHPLPRAVGWLVTFTSVMFGWVLFRSPTLDRSAAIYAGLTGLNGMERLVTWKLQGFSMLMPDIGFSFRLMMIPAILGPALLAPNTQELANNKNVLWAVMLGVCFAWVLTKLSVETPFLYFQF